ncbi:MAG: hypothetical protein ACKO8L_07525, partial [Flavobacterium sp.]
TNDDFSIYTLFNSELINISKDEFPNFQTLISKRKADEKADLESIIEEEKKENINKKYVITTTLTPLPRESLRVVLQFKILKNTNIV